jgi:membrane protein YqaA with SNARE-associated domain
MTVSFFSSVILPLRDEVVTWAFIAEVIKSMITAMMVFTFVAVIK